MANLQELARAGLEGEATRITVDTDVETSSYVFRIWNIPEPDPIWGYITGDCIHNARSALDHLAYQLALVANSGEELSDKVARRVMFPICESKEIFDDIAPKRLKSLRPDDRAGIERLQPYNASDEAIWGPIASRYITYRCAIPDYLAMLERLENSDKHRRVHPAWFGRPLPFGAVPYPPRLNITGGSSATGPFHNGAELATWNSTNNPLLPFPQEVDVKAHFPLTISLGEPTKLETGLLSLFEALGGILIAVAMVIATFEPCIAHGAPPAPLRYWDGLSA